MDATGKSILTAVYVSSISGRSIHQECARRGLDVSSMQKAKQDLIRNGLMKPDGATLTNLGRESLRVVLTGGVFNIIHPGHIHTLNAARRLGNVLVVVVATDETAAKMKMKRNDRSATEKTKKTDDDTAAKMRPKRHIHSQEQRRALVDSLRGVDLCVVGYEGDIFQTVKKVMPEIVALGYDQVHHEKFIADGCRAINPGIQVARLSSPIPDISSSVIEAEYGKELYGI